MSELILIESGEEADPAPKETPKQLNQKQLTAIVFQLAAVEGLDGNKVFYRLRELGQTELKKKNIEEVADKMAADYKAAPPAIKARMRLDASETELVGDIMEALGNLELTNPRDIRECTQHVGHLGSGPSAMEVHIKDAIEWLEEAGAPAYSALMARFSELYPVGSDD